MPGPGRPFQKGKSGNPGGRPRALAEIQHLAREQSEEAVKTLVEIMRNAKSETARIHAADKILDRGWGKAAQSVSATVDEKRSATDWTTAELIAFLNEHAEKGE